ncbi:hypothetical protein HYH03_012245 [Edaphochlamys debaryana]|uniref:Uncharacterized protein n=1 Tax=Edaphochlamys debaryana TaxID=47281 RepID=A0A836BVN2_9CHLO|nr:hypothetical protein HYH03_012245 [Edaphochlamys debaryana]|eukprot:KAG2489223.1 hypothetical protein HYH03_012245 [Edaphochlamys debaryana]
MVPLGIRYGHWRDRHPTGHKIVKACLALLAGGFYWADVITDFLVVQQLFAADEITFAALMLFFIFFQYVIMWVSVCGYVTDVFFFPGRLARAALYACLLPGTFAFDIAMCFQAVAALWVVECYGERTDRSETLQRAGVQGPETREVKQGEKKAERADQADLGATTLMAVFEGRVRSAPQLDPSSLRLALGGGSAQRLEALLRGLAPPQGPPGSGGGGSGGRAELAAALAAARLSEPSACTGALPASAAPVAVAVSARAGPPACVHRGAVSAGGAAAVGVSGKQGSAAHAHDASEEPWWTPADEPPRRRPGGDLPYKSTSAGSTAAGSRTASHGAAPAPSRARWLRASRQLLGAWAQLWAEAHQRADSSNAGAGNEWDAPPGCRRGQRRRMGAAWLGPAGRSRVAAWPVGRGAEADGGVVEWEDGDGGLGPGPGDLVLTRARAAASAGDAAGGKPGLRLTLTRRQQAEEPMVAAGHSEDSGARRVSLRRRRRRSEEEEGCGEEGLLGPQEAGRPRASRRCYEAPPQQRLPLRLLSAQELLGPVTVRSAALLDEAQAGPAGPIRGGKAEAQAGPGPGVEGLLEAAVEVGDEAEPGGPVVGPSAVAEAFQGFGRKSAPGVGSAPSSPSARLPAPPVAAKARASAPGTPSAPASPSRGIGRFSLARPSPAPAPISAPASPSRGLGLGRFSLARRSAAPSPASAPALPRASLSSDPGTRRLPSALKPALASACSRPGTALPRSTPGASPAASASASASPLKAGGERRGVGFADARAQAGPGSGPGRAPPGPAQGSDIDEDSADGRSGGAYSDDDAASVATSVSRSEYKENVLLEQVGAFLAYYRRIRVVVECVFESLPQSVIQLVILSLGLNTDTPALIVLSFIMSILGLVKNAYEVKLMAMRNGFTFGQQLYRLIRMTEALPYLELRENAAVDFEVNVVLKLVERNMLAKALSVNRSLTRFAIADQGLGILVSPIARHRLLDTFVMLPYKPFTPPEFKSAMECLAFPCALHRSVARNLPACTRLLCVKGWDVDRRDELPKARERTPAHWAAFKNFLEPLKVLVEYRPDLNLLDANQKAPLHYAWAIAYGKHKSTVMLRLLLDARASPDVQDGLQRSLLHYAAEKGDTGGAGLVMGYRANLNLQDKYARTPAHLATLAQQGPMVRLLADSKADLDVRDKDERTCLHYAVLRVNEAIIGQLLGHAANPDLQDKLGKTGLHYAVGGLRFPPARRLGVARQLLGARAQPNLYDKEGHVPLHFPARRLRAGNERSAVDEQALIEALLGSSPPADPNLPSKAEGEEGRAPLHFLTDCTAQGAPRQEVVKALLSHGAAPDQLTARGWAPLHLTALHQTEALAGLLLGAKARPDVKEPEAGNAPLHLACRRATAQLRARPPAVLRLLLEAGCERNVQNKEGDTGLHIATRHSDTASVKVLLSHQASPNLLNGAREGPLHIAAAKEDAEVVHELLTQGADPNLRSGMGEAALHLVVPLDNLVITQDLLEHRADPCLPSEADGDTPLHLAARHLGVQVCRALLSRKPNVNTTNRAGERPLHLVVDRLPWPDKVVERRDKAEAAATIITLLADTPGADLSSPCPSTQQHPLFAVAIREYEALTRRLLSRGADPNAQSLFQGQRETLLTAAARGGAASLEAARAVLGDPRTDPNAPSGDGYAPLHLCLLPGKLRPGLLAQLLAHPRLDVDRETKTGSETALWMVCGSRADEQQLDLLRRLLRAGAKPNKFVQGSAPIIRVVELDPLGKARPLEALQALLAAGADPNLARFSDGNTALHLAAEDVRSSELFAALLAGGAKPGLRNRAGDSAVAVLYGATQKRRGHGGEESLALAFRSGGSALDKRGNTAATVLGSFFDDTDRHVLKWGRMLEVLQAAGFVTKKTGAAVWTTSKEQRTEVGLETVSESHSEEVFCFEGGGCQSVVYKASNSWRFDFPRRAENPTLPRGWVLAGK